ncbi:MAG: patatin family protein [Spirochaetia bacterium]|nr:patatin family protein [Spirochaetia bacterium]
MMTGLVMEGGAMRGMFTAGVCDVLMEHRIKFDGAIGVSAGATFGCNYKSHQIGRVIRYNKRFARNWRYCSLRSLFLTGDLYGADFCYVKIPEKLDPFDYETYRNDPMRFYAVVSDCMTGEPIYKELKTGDRNDLEWMRASASMPLVSKPVKIDGYTLLDGGMTDSIPLAKFQEMGYQKNIVILTQPKIFIKEPDSLIKLMRLSLRKYPKLLAKMEDRHIDYNRQHDYALQQEKEGKAIVICPEKPLGISRVEHNPDELQRCYDEGRQVAEKRLEEIKNFLNK